MPFGNARLPLEFHCPSPRSPLARGSSDAPRSTLVLGTVSWDIGMRPCRDFAAPMPNSNMPDLSNIIVGRALPGSIIVRPHG